PDLPGINRRACNSLDCRGRLKDFAQSMRNMPQNHHHIWKYGSRSMTVVPMNQSSAGIESSKRIALIFTPPRQQTRRMRVIQVMPDSLLIAYGTQDSISPLPTGIYSNIIHITNLLGEVVARQVCTISMFGVYRASQKAKRQICLMNPPYLYQL
ncbi:MAG: hypothetical protein KAV87_50180, partial [Desulfobacteraceae bacterium]|nr:hypothetical protein [Desulfobacteraceae bacterium]